MAPQKRTAVDSPIQRVVVHHLGLVIAQCDASTAERAKRRMAWADSIGRSLDLLAPEVEAMMKEWQDLDGHTPGPGVVRELRAMVELHRALQVFRPRYERYMSEHAACVNPSVATVLARYFEWIEAQLVELRGAVESFNERVGRELREDRDRNREFAGIWSGTDSDGLG